jgi:hypothetical protein
MFELNDVFVAYRFNNFCLFFEQMYILSVHIFPFDDLHSNLLSFLVVHSLVNLTKGSLTKQFFKAVVFEVFLFFDDLCFIKWDQFLRASF